MIATLLLGTALALAGPASTPFTAQGDYWQIRLALPVGWKGCTTPAPGSNHGFALVPRGQDCAAPAALSLVFDYNLDDEVPSAQALLQRAGCTDTITTVSFNGQSWARCTQEHGLQAASTVQQCGENPNTAVLFTLSEYKDAGAAAGPLFARILENLVIRCPAASGSAVKAHKTATTPVVMHDPLFGLSYDTTKIRFERLPAAIAKKADLGTQPQWIYARSERDGITLTLVSGFQRMEPDARRSRAFSIEPDFGAVLRSEGDTVEVLGVPDSLYGDEAIVTPAEREPLLADAVKRYIAAWGGKDGLQAVLRDFERPDVVPASLREALRAQSLHVGAAGTR